MFHQKMYLFIDFDSTFISVESLEVLADTALQNHPRKKDVLLKIAHITNQGMEGKITFHESLRQRLKLFSADKKMVVTATRKLQKLITPSIEKNKTFFKQKASAVHVISSGFSEMIRPIVSSFSILPQNIHANAFIYDALGRISGVDESSPLSYNLGKVNIIQKLSLPGKVLMVGDGYTDYEVKKHKAADLFCVFTENVSRERVTELADAIAPSFDCVIELYENLVSKT